MAERALTPEDRDKIRRLLETADPDNVRLAVSLLEETASDEDVDSILSEDMILTLLTSGNPELFVRTGQLALGVGAVWQRFSDWATEFWAVPLDRFTYEQPEGDGFIDFSGLTSLSDVLAESLSEHKGSLDLNGLTSLSDVAAESLSRQEGALRLNGLTTLSDAAAQSLSEHRGSDITRNILYLNGLTSLSDSAADRLRHFEGELYLNGLSSLSGAAAESLSEQKSFMVGQDTEGQCSGSLSLPSLTSLSDAAAESLGKHKTGLDLDGLTSLPDSTAEILSQHPSFQDE